MARSSFKHPANRVGLGAGALLLAGLLAFAARPATAVRPAADRSPIAHAAGYSLSAGGHAPKAGRPWTVTVRGGSGRVSLDVVFAGAVVGHITRGALHRGRFTYTVRWPARAAGYPLTLRATITGPRRPVSLSYAVKVHR